MREYSENHTLLSIDEDEVRGGVTGHNVRYVLAAGLVLAVAGFLAVTAFL